METHPYEPGGPFVLVEAGHVRGYRYEIGRSEGLNDVPHVVLSMEDGEVEREAYSLMFWRVRKDNRVLNAVVLVPDGVEESEMLDLIRADMEAEIAR